MMVPQPLILVELTLGKRENGKENGNYYTFGIIYGLFRGYIGVILRLYRDNGKENGNCYGLGFRV